MVTKKIFFLTKVSRFYTSGELNLTSMYVLIALFQSYLDTLYSVYRSLYVYGCMLHLSMEQIDEGLDCQYVVCHRIGARLVPARIDN